MAATITVHTPVWIDVEVMQISAISGTQITVVRGVMGRRAESHDNADGVFTGAAGHFHTNDPNFGQDCTRGQNQAAFLPWFNVRTGWIWTCDVGTDWQAYAKANLTVNSEPTTF